MTRAARALEAAQLTPEELERILRVCGSHALVVGGQALATWAAHYGTQPLGVLSESITMDADFIGTRAVAQALRDSLGPPWKLRKGTMDDVGGQIAKVYATVPKHGLKQVDFLTGVVGLDEDRARARCPAQTG